VRRALVVSSIAFFALAAGAPPAAAQAWVSPSGEGSVTFVTQMINHVGRLSDDGTRVGCCGTTNIGLDVEIDYAFTDRWSISADLPYIFAKYRGEAPVGPAAFLPYVAVDSCHCVHSAFQDVGLTARFNLINLHRAFMLTPSISLGVPSHSYDHVGEAVVGFGLKELGMGADVGQRLDAILPGLSVEGRYNYTVVPRVLNIPHNRSNALVQGGFAFTRHLSAHAILSWQRTHGGLHFPADVEPFPERYPEFHRLLQDNYLQVGAGASYSRHQWDVSASFLRVASGTNSHDVHVITVNVGWLFEAGGGG
jgi:hypothetical protein